MLSSTVSFVRVASAMVVAIALGLGVGPTERAVAASPWGGSVSLRAAAVTHVNAPMSTSLLTVSPPLGTGRAVSIFDSTGLRVYCSTNSATSSVQGLLTPPTNQARTYTAYVSDGSCPAIVPGTPLAVSDSITVTNVGYVGAVDLQVLAATTDANSPATSAVVTLGWPLRAPYSLSMFDDTGVRQFCPSNSAVATWQTSVTPPPNQARIYTAYVAQGGCSTSPPTVDVHASQGVTVTNVGYTGTVSLTATPEEVAAGSSQISMSAAISRPLPSGWRLAVYDSTGVKLRSCTTVGATTCTGSTTLGPEPLRYFAAVVAPTDPIGALPAGGTWSSMQAVVASGTDRADWAASAAIAPATAALVQQRGAQDACFTLGESLRLRGLRATVSDLTLVCNSLGIARAVEFLFTTVGLVAAQTVLDDAVHSATSEFHPDCDHLGAGGLCLDEQDENSLTPEPAPAGAGGRIPPPPSCLDPEARDDLLASLSLQDHHMASDKNWLRWTPQFAAIASQFGLVLDAPWNVRSVKQSGSHPTEYHEWVFSNMTVIRDAALSEPTVDAQREMFRSLFKAWVVDVVEADPSILRTAYWECYR